LFSSENLGVYGFIYSFIVLSFSYILEELMSFRVRYETVVYSLSRDGMEIIQKCRDKSITPQRTFSRVVKFNGCFDS